MSEKLYICNKADKCIHGEPCECRHNIPHKRNSGCNTRCFHNFYMNCILVE